MIYELISFGGVIHWALIAVFFLVITQIVAEEESVMAPLWLVVILGALTYAFTDAKIPEVTWVEVLVTPLSYLFTGVMWAMLKWTILVRKISIYSQTTDFTYEPANYEVGRVSQEELERRNRLEMIYDKFCPNDLHSYHDFSLPPEASQFRTRITSWMAFWPVSILVTMLWFVPDLFSKLFNTLSGVFNKISSSTYEG